MPRSPQWMDLYQIWFRMSFRGRNQLCGILLQSAHGFRFCEGSKFAISHWLGRSPLTQCWRYRAACDRCNVQKIVKLSTVGYSVMLWTLIPCVWNHLLGFRICRHLRWTWNYLASSKAAWSVPLGRFSGTHAHFVIHWSHGHTVVWPVL